MLHMVPHLEKVASIRRRVAASSLKDGGLLFVSSMKLPILKTIITGTVVYYLNTFECGLFMK
jgi:hypothetical protein